MAELKRNPDELMVEQRVDQGIADSREIWPVNTNRASELGHPCERYLVYMRTIPPEKRRLVSVGTQKIFRLGKKLEGIAKQDLIEYGKFKLYDITRGKVWQSKKISGHVDTQVMVPWKKNLIVPVEIKGLNHILWMKLVRDPWHALELMWNDKRSWVRKYPAQLLIYLLLHDKEEGFFWLKDKLTWDHLCIWMNLNEYLDVAESLIKKSERINKHVEDETLPEGTKDYYNVCRTCEFQEICLPDMSLGDELHLIDSADMEEKLNLLASLKPNHKEYNLLKKEVTAELRLLAPKKKVVIGEWLITYKDVEKNITARIDKYIDVRVKYLGDA